MKNLVLIPKKDSFSYIEETISLFEMDAVEIINPCDRIYNEFAEAEFDPNRQKPESASIKVYLGNRNADEILEFYSDHLLSHTYEEVEEQDWNRKWASQFTGTTIGDVLFIRPQWVEKREGLIDIVIDPEMAFGTGSHETTRLCAELLMKYVKANDTLYDVGCGSGILSVVAKHFGAGKIVALEYDETALKNAKKNIILNECSDVIIKQADLLKGQDAPVDVIVANLISPLIQEMHDDAVRLLKKEGILIVSGLLDAQTQGIIDLYDELQLLEKTRMGEWNALVFQKDE